MYVFFLLLFLLPLLGGGVHGQEVVRLAGHSFVPEANMVRVRGRMPSMVLPPSTGSARDVLVQLHSLPDAAARAALRDRGLDLGSYVGGSAYFAKLDAGVDPQRDLQGLGLRSVMGIRREWKLAPSLAAGAPPEWSLEGDEGVHAVVCFSKGTDVEAVREGLGAIPGLRVETFSSLLSQAQVSVGLDQVNALGDLPFVLSVWPVEPKQELLNVGSRMLSRAGVLSAPAELGGRGLDGEGIRVGVWDGNVLPHVDFGDRVHRMEYTLRRGAEHGTHVSGTIGGAGMLDPDARGMAPKVEFYTWNFLIDPNERPHEDEMAETAEKYGITITSNSYGLPLEAMCSFYRSLGYNTSSMRLDQVALSHPYTLHVHSAGNAQEGCPIETMQTWGESRYGTSAKRSKNILTVAALDASGGMAPFSSWGPMPDGRLVPLVGSKGVQVYSTAPNNGYQLMSGTSMSCPTVSGTVALIEQRFKQLNKGMDPRADLIKAVVMNTANDAGRKGPDFSYGYGIVDGEKAVETLEHGWYKELEVENGGEVSFDLDIPSGATQAKVMLYWHDAVSEKQYGYEEKVLVNDLDLEVGGHLPLTLNGTPNHMMDLAEEGVDRLNNQEQVVLESPAGGVQRVTVRGFSVPTGKQRCVVTWYYEMPVLRVLCPGNDKHYSGEQFRLSVSGVTSGYSSDLSVDGGKSWRRLGAIPKYDPLLGWNNQPAVTLPKGLPLANEALVRVRELKSGKLAISSPFIIAPQIKDLVLVAGGDCDKSGYRLTWTPDPVAEKGYVVLKGNLTEGEWSVLSWIDDPNTGEYALSPADVANGVAYAVAATVDKDKQLWGKRSKGVQTHVSEPLVLHKEDFPSREAFLDYPGQSHWKSWHGENMRERVLATNRRFTPWLPVGSNYIAFEALDEADAACSGSQDKPEEYFDWDNEHNRANMAYLQLCEVDLSEVDETVLFRLTGTLISRGSYMRVVFDGESPELKNRELVSSVGAGPIFFNGKDIRDQTNFLDYWFEMPRNNAGKYEKGRLRVEFFGIVARQSMLNIRHAGFELASEQKDFSVAIISMPSSRAKMGMERCGLMVGNNSYKSYDQLTIQTQVNGKPQMPVLLEGLKPMETRFLDFEVDLSTQRVLGEAMVVEAWCDAAGDATPANNASRRGVFNKGNIFPMPECEYYVNPFNGQSAADNPLVVTTMESGKVLLFTDNGGAMQDYDVPQDKTTLKVKPSAANRAVQVRFKKFSLGRDSFLDIYTADVPEPSLSLRDVEPKATLEGCVEEEMVFTSEATDGALTFFFRGMEPGEGWLAEISEVERMNPLSLVSVHALKRGDAAKADVPIEVKVRNKWVKPINDLRITVSYGLEEDQVVKTFERTIGPKETKTFTLEGFATLGQMHARNIYVSIASGMDMVGNDNQVDTWMIYDKYVTPSKPSYSGLNVPYNFKTLQTLNAQELGFKAPGKDYADPTPFVSYSSDTWPLFDMFDRQGFTVRVFSNADEEYRLAYWIDWDENGEFEDVERVLVDDLGTDVEGKVNYKDFSFEIAKNPTASLGLKRMRMVVGPESELTTAKLSEGLASGAMQDVTLDFKQISTEGKKPDVELKHIIITRSGLNLTDQEPLSLVVQNVSIVPYDKELTVNIELDGEKLTEQFDFSSDPLQPMSGYKEITLATKLNLKKVGKHSLSVSIAEEGGAISTAESGWDNNILPPVTILNTVPSGEDYCMHFQSSREHSFKEYVELETGMPAGQQVTDLAIEFWLFLPRPQFATILEAGRDFMLMTAHKMNQDIPDNCVILQYAGGGGDTRGFTEENSLLPGMWNHLSLEINQLSDGTFRRVVYINGKAHALENMKGAPTLGKFKLGSRMDGYIDGLRIWLKDKEGKTKMFSRTRDLADKDGLSRSLAFNEGTGNFFTANNTHAAGVDANYYRIVTYDQDRLSDEQDGIWKKLDYGRLFGGASFEGMATGIVPKNAEFTEFDAPFPSSHPMTVKGTILSLWPETKVTYKGAAVDENTMFDFSSPVVLTLTHDDMFGADRTQTVTITRIEEKAADCELLNVTLLGEGSTPSNPGVASDMAVTVGSDEVISFAMGSKPSKPEAMYLDLSYSAGASVQVNGKDYSVNEPIDLRKPAWVQVLAANGHSKRWYMLRLSVSQQLEWTLAKSDFAIGDEPVALSVSSSSGLPVTVRSTKGNVCAAADGMLRIGAPGVAELVATQPGDGMYAPASALRKSVTVGKKSVTVRPEVADVEYGERLVWHFVYEGLAQPRDAYNLPYALKDEAAGYVVKDSEGKVYSPMSILPKGTYSIVPQHDTYETSRYSIAAKEQGSLVVKPSDDLVTMTVFASRRGKAIEEGTVVVGTKSYAIADGRAIIPVRSYSDAHFSVQAANCALYQGVATVEDEDLTVEVELAPIGVHLTYSAGLHGRVAGDLEQSLAKGGDGSPMLALPDPGYAFEKWSDNESTDPHRQDLNVESDVVAKALFKRVGFNLRYSIAKNSAGVAGGQFTSAASTQAQNLDAGQAGEAVTVEAFPGYSFVMWSDGKTEATRIDVAEGDASYEAIFAMDVMVPMSLDFEDGLMPITWAVASDSKSVMSIHSGVVSSPKYKIICKGKTLVERVDDWFDSYDGLNPYHSYFTSGEINVMGLSHDLHVDYDLFGASESIFKEKSMLQYRLGDASGWGDWVDLQRLHSNHLKSTRHSATIPYEDKTEAVSKWVYEDGEWKKKTENVTTAGFKGKRLQVRFLHVKVWEQALGLDNIQIYEAKSDPLEVSYQCEPATVGATFEVEGAIVSKQTVSNGAIAKPVTTVFDSEQWKFKGWYDEGDFLVSKDPCFTAEVSTLEATTLTAKFIPAEQFLLSYGASPAEAGTFEDKSQTPLVDQVVMKGQDAKAVVAKAETGYAFSYWMEDGLDTPERLDTDVQGDFTYIAVFAKGRYDLVFNVRVGGKPVEGVKVAIMAQGLPRMSDAAGQVLYKLMPGEYTYSVESSDFVELAPASVEIVDQKVEVNLDLEYKTVGHIILLSKTLDLKSGEHRRLGYRMYPERAPRTVTWSSSDDKIATVNADGVVHAIAKGEVEITAVSTIDPSVSAVCVVKVDGGSVTPEPEPQPTPEPGPTPGNGSDDTEGSGLDTEVSGGSLLLSVYPNPAHGELHVASDGMIVGYEIRTLSGAVVLSNRVNSPDFTIQLDGLQRGMYLLRLESTGGYVEVRRFVKM